MVTVPTLNLVREAKICDLMVCNQQNKTLGGQRSSGEGKFFLRGL
jgi:hypothetical protein